MAEIERIVRWGVLGTARIATKVGAAIRRVPQAELLAVASRSEERAAQWAADHSALRSHGSYEKLLDDPDVDAVYIPLPPSLHAEWTIKAAEKGKHVLCEKPLATSVAHAEEMAAACREHNVQLMDGVMWLHSPRATDMLRPIREGTLGTLRRVTTSFTFCWDELPENEIRLERELGGGALGDLGWYCVGATLWAFGDLPERVFATARYHRDVDLNLSALLWFEGERMASFDCGFDVGMRKWFEVAGTEGSLVCDDFTIPWNADKPRYWLNDTEGGSSEQTSQPRIQEETMIEDFCNIVGSGKLDADWTRRALATQRVCDAVDRSARTGAVVEL